MLSPALRVLWKLCCCVVACCVLSACGKTAQPLVEPVGAQPQQPQQQSEQPQRLGICSSEQLRGQIEAIASATKGPVGAALMLIETKDVVAFNGDRKFPMQSVYKLPIAMAVLHQVDAGTLKLEQKVEVREDDFAPGLQHSGFQEMYRRGASVNVRDLLRFMVSNSDGAACDVLLRVVGGAEQVTKYLRELGIEGIVVATTEKEMQGDVMVQYRNWAQPESMLELLRLLQEGQGLSTASRGLLLELMIKSLPGQKRIKGLLPAGTVVAHKTGTSGTVDGLTRATNDVGIITLPDGRHLAVAIFVSDTKADEPVRESVIAQIARAAWDCQTQQKAVGK